MNIHNSMEDIVIKYLNEILELKSDICKCENCKSDMACYALNRIKPMYVVSSRGLIHTENKRREYIQDEIDIYSTIMEAVEVVSSTRRNNSADFKHLCVEAKEAKKYDSDCCYFNFPQIIGRVLESPKIEPILNARVSLFHEEGKNRVTMFNQKWNNPVNIVDQMDGFYTFWPAPIPSDRSGIQKDFYMYLEITKEGFDPTCKYFYVRVISEEKLRSVVKKENIYYVNDIYIYPEGSAETDK